MPRSNPATRLPSSRDHDIRSCVLLAGRLLVPNNDSRQTPMDDADAYRKHPQGVGPSSGYPYHRRHGQHTLKSLPHLHKI